MEEMTDGVLSFIRWTELNPLSQSASTREVLNALRAHLDATVPNWRERLLEAGGAECNAFRVEVHFEGGRVMTGMLLQQSTAAGDEST